MPQPPPTASSDSSPATFPGVVGHEQVVAMLARAIERGRLHHALVFAGPRGIGKATLARGLACALNCEVAPARGCGTCVICRRVLLGRHPDFVALEGTGKSRAIKIDDAREVSRRAQHAPLEGRAHVIVIDPADRMDQSAGALLKSIEEPSPGVHWVLLTTNAGDLLDTIASRCMTISLGRLNAQQTAAVVDAELEHRGLASEITDERRQLAISLSDGCPGMALELLSDTSLEPTRELLAATLAAVERGPGAVFSGDRSPLWQAWKEAVLAAPDPDDETPSAEPEPEVVVVKGKAPRALKPKKPSKAAAAKETPSRQRAAAGRVTELWLLHLRERLLGRRGLADVPSSGPADGDQLTRQMRAIQQFQTNLVRNPNVRLSFEQLLLSLSEGT